MKELENIIIWVNALESGIYKQGTRYLGNKDIGFCCLGVGCKILGIEYYSEQLCSKEFISSDGHLIKGKAFYNEVSLTSINDASKAGFKRIAKLIKTHPDWLFREKVAEAVKNHYS